MKATKLSLFTLLMFILPVLVYSGQTSAANEIPISGKTEIPRTHPRVPSAPILQAYQTGNIITVYFLNDAGSVNITITSKTGETVYQNSVPAGDGISEIINTSDFAEGSYLITFTNSGDMFLQGEFVI